MRIPIVLVLCALTIYRNSLWSQGAALWKDAVEKAGNKGRIYINLGTSLVGEGATFEAAKAFDQALKKGLPDALASITLYDAGLLLQKMGDLSKAEEYYRSALERDPTNIRARNNLGAILLVKGELEEAEKELKAAGLSQSFASLGILYELQGKTKEAEEWFLKAINTNPSLKNLHYMFGGFLMRTGRRGEAVYYFKEAVRRDPADALVLNSLGNALLEEEKVDEAVSYLRRALHVDKDLAPAHNNLGLAYFKQGKPEDAVKEITRAIEISPDHADFHNNLGAVLYSGGKEQDALKEYREALSLMPCSSGAHNNMGIFYQGKKMYPRAISEFRKAVQCDPYYYRALYSLGMCYQQTGEKEKALRALKRAVEIAPDFTPALEELVKLRETSPSRPSFSQ